MDRRFGDVIYTNIRELPPLDAERAAAWLPGIFKQIDEAKGFLELQARTEGARGRSQRS